MSSTTRESCEQVCGQLANHSDVIDLKGLKQPVKESEMQFKVTPDDLIGEGVINQSCIYKVSRSLLWVMRIFGRLPYGLDDGWMKSSFASLPFAYCFSILTLNFGLHVYYHEHLKHAFRDLSEAITFSRVLFSAMIILQTAGVWMTVFSWIFETKFIVRNYNTTAVLERKLAQMIPTSSFTPTTRTVIEILIGFYFTGLVLVSLTLLILRFPKEPLPVLFMFTFNLVGNQSHTVMWCVNNIFIRTLAVQLEVHMTKSLKLGINRAQKLRTCRKAWISIWEQAQNNSHAFSSTVTFCLINYGVTFVASTYGLISSIINFDTDEVFATFPYFGASLIMVFAIVESAHQAKYKLGDEFLIRMIHLDKDNMDRGSLEEVDNFSNVILQTDKAQFSLKGYLVIGRPLFVSFLSYTVTYLIVLLQFQQSEEQPHGTSNAKHPIGTT